VVLRRRQCALSAALKQQRHITPNATEEIKLDGYRALAGRSGDQRILLSRNDNDLSERFPAVANALTMLPDETLVDGELAILDKNGKPSFRLIQNYQSSKGTLVYFSSIYSSSGGCPLWVGRLMSVRPFLRKRSFLNCVSHCGICDQWKERWRI
jgi:hypothetical protein